MTVVSWSQSDVRWGNSDVVNASTIGKRWTMQDMHWGARAVLKSERPSVVDWLVVSEVDIKVPFGDVEDDC